MKYTEFPKSEQPVQRIRELGPTALSNAELFSIALSLRDTDQAQAICQMFADAQFQMNRIPRDKLKSVYMVGDSHADTLLAIAELGRRQAVGELTDRPQINSPADAAAMVQYEMAALEHEELWVILLDIRNRVKRIVHLYKGSVNSSQVRVGELFRDAIREQATCVVLAHNHPSGDPTPSPDDVALTRATVQAAKLLDLQVLDHIVIGGSKWASLKDRGLGFS